MKDAEKPCPGVSWDWNTVVITLLGAITEPGAELPHPVASKDASSSLFPLHTWQTQNGNNLVFLNAVNIIITFATVPQGKLVPQKVPKIVRMEVDSAEMY